MKVGRLLSLCLILMNRHISECFISKDTMCSRDSNISRNGLHFKINSELLMPSAPNGYEQYAESNKEFPTLIAILYQLFIDLEKSCVVIDGMAFHRCAASNTNARIKSPISCLTNIKRNHRLKSKDNNFSA